MSPDMSILLSLLTVKTVEKTTCICRQITFVKQSIDSVDCRSNCRSIVEIERQTVDTLLILFTSVYSNETLQSAANSKMRFSAVNKQNTQLYDNGRGCKIRTCDPLVPNQVRYQTAPSPDWVVLRPISARFQGDSQSLRKLSCFQ